MNVSVVQAPKAAKPNSHYASNQAPLLVNPMAKLPLGAVRPKGWLKHQLDLMVDGMIGRLGEISPHLADDSGWLSGKGWAWEEVPYWLRGFYSLAVLTGDERCLAEANRWLDGVIATQQADGYFGGSEQKAHNSLDGSFIVPDLWAQMPMIDAFLEHHEATGDERAIPFLMKFFDWCRKLPDESFMPEAAWGRNGMDMLGTYHLYWGVRRSGDMLAPLYFLYNRTGKKWLLDLATRFYHGIEPAEDEWLDHHIVNFTQRFAYGGLYYQQSHRAYHLDQTEFWYAQHNAAWGQQPRGIFGADENIRTGKVDPRQGFETCGFTEYAKNFYLLGRATGSALYADRTEDILLNHFPASQDPALKTLHYLTAANMPQLDATGDHDFQNEGEQVSFSPGGVYRCCQHNVAMGWPWYAENLWQASADDGLVAWMYSACEVTAKVGKAGREVTISQKTDYPFNGKVTLKVSTASGRAEKFPLYLRVPAWATSFRLRVAGEAVKVDATPGQYVRIDRAWANGDTVSFDMGMKVSMTTWPRTGAVTVDRGPLSYSVKIDEDWRQKPGTTERWPEWEVFPASPWNYGLVVDGEPADIFEVVESKKSLADQPWTPDDAPITIKAKAKQIPDWCFTKDQTVPEVQPSPIKQAGPAKKITLIPLGCARLRMSVLPTIENSPDAREWRRMPYTAKLRDAGEYEQG